MEALLSKNQESNNISYISEYSESTDNFEIINDLEYTDQNDLIDDNHDNISNNSLDLSKYNGLRVSEDDYWKYYYELPDVVLEWNNGILEEKPVSDLESFKLYYWFLGLVMQYLNAYDEGILVGLEIGFRLNVDDSIKIRKPDLAFIHKNNLNQMKPLETSYKGCFDMCFEFLSDTNKMNIERDTIVKKHEYEKFGVREYFILDRKGNETSFYFLNSKGIYEKNCPDSNGVIKSKVLKNFQFRLKDFYERPDYKTLVDDKVYSKYILKEFQLERKRANKLEKKVEAERKRAENERKRADKVEISLKAERIKSNALEKEIQKLKNFINTNQR